MRQEYETEFRAMGTLVTVAVVEDGQRQAPGSLEQVERLFMEEEARFSRFVENSELCQLNAEGGTDDPSPQMWDVLRRTQTWWKKSGGVFDPTVLPALEQAGYDRSFENIDSASPRGHEAGGETRPPIGFQHVRFIEEGGSRHIRLDEGVRLDLGGIVKGWTVDRAANILSSACDFMIDAGGDIRAAGKGPGSHGWWVAVEDPMAPEHDLGYLQIVDAAVATSASYRRKWTDGNGRTNHHLIDPGTGMSSETEVVCATVRGSDAEHAEVVAKAVLLAGGYTSLGGLVGVDDVDICVTYENGSQIVTPGWDIVMARDAVLIDRGE